MKKRNHQAYFAAANSYRGFVGYFDTVLSGENPARLFIIKGGPGTGKSSLMKKLHAALLESDCECELIYCSSDPRSLDGVIARRGDKCIAVIDGTAPHTRDAKVPGAIDELVNLGLNWDERWLVSKCDIIESLSHEKSKAYSTAYAYLGIAGEAYRYKYNIIRGSFDFSRAIGSARKFSSEYSSGEVGEKKVRLVSSFGKQGEYRLGTIEENAKKLFSLSGNTAAANIYLNVLSDILTEQGIAYTHFPTPLAPECTEAVSLTSGISVATFGEGERINTDEFITASKLDLETVKRAEEIRLSALEEAVRWFSIASDLHFRLEEIYSQAMNFEKNDEMLKKILEKCVNILEI